MGGPESGVPAASPRLAPGGARRRQGPGEARAHRARALRRPPGARGGPRGAAGSPGWEGAGPGRAGRARAEELK